jgi:hypothetical protein
VRETRGRTRLWAYASLAWVAAVLVITPALVLPQTSRDEPAKRVWHASVRYTEEGIVTEDREDKKWRKWSKHASAQYTLTTYEHAEQGFVWENASVSYADKYHAHDEVLYEGGADTYWDVSGDFTLKSIDDLARQAEEAAHGGQSNVRGAVFGGLVLHRQGDRVMALETPGIGVNAFHPGAKTIRTKDSTRREDVRVSIGHAPDHALTQEERQRRQQRMEQMLKPQVDDLVKKEMKVIEEQKAMAEKYKALAEKFKPGAPKGVPPAKPGQPELTPEMAAYLEKMLGSLPPEAESAGERVAEVEQSQEALIMATLEQGGGQEFTGQTITGARQWGATEEERLWGGLEGNVSIARTLSWTFVPLSKDQDVRITIIQPKPDTQYIFGEKSSTQIIIEAKAKVEPAKYAGEVEWDVENIEGSQKTIDPLKGEQVRVIFNGLPAKSNQFGKKKITARVRGKEDQVTIKVFFRKDAKDNPEGNYPNWFYYWRQGAVAGLERFAYEPGGSYYDPATQKLVISDDAATSLIGGTIPLKKAVTKRDGTRCNVQTSIVISPTKGLDSVARVVAHELEHYQRFLEIGKKGDHDDDRVPTSTENVSLFCLDFQNPNTHNLNPKDGTAGDDELLAMAAEAQESKSKSRVKPNLDWACPGSQCKGGK